MPIVDVLDVASAAQRASADAQRRYDTALSRVDQVISETVDVDAHPRRLAEAIRRQVLAARSGRSPSPDVEDVCADDPRTWPDPESHGQPLLGHHESWVG